jgi:hypothetical protein
MVEEEGGKPEPRNMVSAQPPATNPRLLLTLICRVGYALPIVEKRESSVRLAEFHIQRPTTERDVLDLLQPERKMQRRLGRDAVLKPRPKRWWFKGGKPHDENRLLADDSKALTNDNALTELAVRSSLSGRSCDAGCNTTTP